MKTIVAILIMFASPSLAQNTIRINNVDISISMSPSEGSKSAPVTVVYLTSFLCKPCKRSSKTVAKVREYFQANHPGKVRFIFKNGFFVTTDTPELLKPEAAKIYNKEKVLAEYVFMSNSIQRFWQFENWAFHYQDYEDPGSELEKIVPLQLAAQFYRDPRLSVPMTNYWLREKSDQRKLKSKCFPEIYLNSRKVCGSNGFSEKDLIDDIKAEIKN